MNSHPGDDPAPPSCGVAVILLVGVAALAALVGGILLGSLLDHR